MEAPTHRDPAIPLFPKYKCRCFPDCGGGGTPLQHWPDIAEPGESPRQAFRASETSEYEELTAQPPDLPSSRAQPGKWVRTVDSGGREKRSPQTFRVLLSNGEKPLSIQYVSTENVSPYGARVRTNRPWKTGT